MANTLAEMEALVKTSTAQVLMNINEIVKGYEKKVYAKAQVYATMVLADFMSIQLDAGIGHRGEFWTNRTGKAASGWYTKAYWLKASGSIGFWARQSNTVLYASALEEWVKSGTGETSTETMIRKYASSFLQEVNMIITGQKGNILELFAEEFD